MHTNLGNTSGQARLSNGTDELDYKRSHDAVNWNSEAAFAHDNLFVRADILVKKGSRVELIEVKAKAYDGEPMANKKGTISSKWHTALHDVAFQKHVLALLRPFSGF